MTTETTKNENYFAQLAKIDVSKHVEKKGRFSYLSWAWAVKVIREFDPTISWEVKRFDGVPYMVTDCGYFVEVAVTAQGITLSQIHPVLDNNNRPIAKPNSFQINTSIQRCLVKAIGLHGLGLYIYAGEDLPEVDEENQQNESSAPQNAISAKQIGFIKVLVGKFSKLCEKADKDVYEALKIADVTKLTGDQAKAAIDKLNGWIKAKEEAK